MPVTLALYKVTVIFGPMYCTWQIQISRVTAPTLQSSMNQRLFVTSVLRSILRLNQHHLFSPFYFSTDNKQIKKTRNVLNAMIIIKCKLASVAQHGLTFIRRKLAAIHYTKQKAKQSRNSLVVPMITLCHIPHNISL